MPLVRRGPVLCVNKIKYDKEGRVIDPENIQKLIFKGVKSHI